MAELLKRGVIAALAPRNAPSFDILATKQGQMVRIRVKTKSEGYDEWQWVVKKDGTLFRDLSPTRDFTVLVDLAQETKNVSYYVVPTSKIDLWLKERHDRWLNTPGKHGRPHNPSNRKRQLNQRKQQAELRPYLNHWDILWEAK